MDKDTLKAIIYKIAAMGKLELEDYDKDISMSNIDGKARNFINRAMTIKRDELSRGAVGLEAVCSDIDADGGDYD